MKCFFRIPPQAIACDSLDQAAALTEQEEAEKEVRSRDSTIQEVFCGKMSNVEIWTGEN